MTTTETTYTPGPWKPLWSEATGEVFIAPIDAEGIAGNAVAALDEMNTDHATLGANARLIAAAPDMYEALRAIVMGDHLSAREAYAMGSAAIAKAEGRA
jgi:5,10-methenyltetrahydromethanopterin hydrogenase